MNCPKCGAKMTVDVILEGGCGGHDDGEYCYCPSPDVRAEWDCPNTNSCGYGADGKYGARPKKDVCSQRSIRIDELSDHDSFARYLTKNYKPC